MSARPGGNMAAALAAAGGVVKSGQPQVEETRFCEGCRYAGTTSGMLFCDYLGITGHPRTVYRGIKTDRCPRKRAAARKG